MAERLVKTNRKKTSAVVPKSKKSKMVLKRVYDAPRELVWEAWVDTKLLSRLWGASGLSNPVREVDLKEGGAIRIHMRTPEGVIYPIGGFFKKIVSPQQMVFTSVTLDKQDQPILENLNTVTFEKQGEKTLLTLAAEVVRATGDAEPHLKEIKDGWAQGLERLADRMKRYID